MCSWRLSVIILLFILYPCTHYLKWGLLCFFSVGSECRDLCFETGKLYCFLLSRVGGGVLMVMELTCLHLPEPMLGPGWLGMCTLLSKPRQTWILLHSWVFSRWPPAELQTPSGAATTNQWLLEVAVPSVYRTKGTLLIFWPLRRALCCGHGERDIGRCNRTLYLRHDRTEGGSGATENN